MGGIARSVLAGAIGGLVGTVVWAIISYYANAEVGWIAWGIGFVVGVFVRVAAGENFEGFLPGAIAALISIVSVVAGKYAAVSMAVSSIAAANVEVNLTDEEMIVGMADEIIKERESKGQKVQFPAGKTLEEANAQADYPPAIWREASQKWTKLGPDAQAKQRNEQQARMREFMGQIRGQVKQQAFAESFGPFDALWFILAALTAYKIGHGNISSDDD